MSEAEHQKLKPKNGIRRKPNFVEAFPRIVTRCYLSCLNRHEPGATGEDCQYSRLCHDATDDAVEEEERCESNINMDGPSSQFSDNGSHELLEQMHPGSESRLARGFQIPQSCHNRRWQVMFGQFRDRITERCEDDVIVDEDLFSFSDSVLSSNDAIQDSVMLRNPQVGLENIETQEDLSLGANECTRLINGSQPADETAKICESIDLEREAYSGLRTQPGHEIGNRHSFRIEFENENHFVEVTNYEIGDKTKKLKVDDNTHEASVANVSTDDRLDNVSSCADSEVTISKDAENYSVSPDELLVGDESFECLNFVYPLERRNHGCCIDQDQEYIGECRRNDMASFEQVDKITNLQCGCTEMAVFKNGREETPGCECGIDEIASMDQESNEMFDFRRGWDEMNTWENYETTRSELENCGIIGIESDNEMVAICESRNCGMTRFDGDNDEATVVDQRTDGQNSINGGTVRSVDSSLSLLELNCFENIVTRAISIESLGGSLEQTPHDSSDGVPALFSPTPVSIPLSCHSRSDDVNNRSISSRHSHSSESLSGMILDPVLPRRERRHSDPFGTSSSNETSCSNDSRSGRENWYFYDPRLMPSRGRRAAPVWSFFQQLRGQRASIVAPPAYEEITPSYNAIGSSNDPIMTVPSSTNPVEASNMQTSYATDAHLSDDEQAPPPPYQETDPQPVAPPIYEAAPPTYDEALQANAVEDLANPSPVIPPDGQSGEDEVGSRQPTDCWYLIPRCSPSSGIFGGQRAMRWNGSSGVDRWASAHSWLRT